MIVILSAAKNPSWCEKEILRYVQDDIPSENMNFPTISLLKIEFFIGIS